MHYILFYETAPDYLERRGQFRAEHLALAWRYADRGEMVLAGALANPPDGAVFLFHGDSPDAAEAFAQDDPYVKNGLIKNWRVREWTTVVGLDATSPIRPEL